MLLPLELRQWARRHGLTPGALAELAQLLGAVQASPAAPGASESNVQARVRLAAPGVATRLWRNNVGVLTDARGVPVRYGLANDSPALNASLKSHDLIGWRRVTITPEMVGSVVAQFASYECKRADWRPGSGGEREIAQARWAALVVAEGGVSKFVTGPEQL